MKRIGSLVLCVCMILVLSVCSSVAMAEEEYTPINEGALCGTQYENAKLEVLSYEYDDDWHSYEDVSEGAAVIVRFYFENDGEDPLYMLESFGVLPFQDGVELEYISLNSDDKECTNVTTHVKDGAGIYCKMAFRTTSDSDVELLISEPTAEAAKLAELVLEHGESSTDLQADIRSGEEISLVGIYEFPNNQVSVWLRNNTNENQCIDVCAWFDNTDDGLVHIYEETLCGVKDNCIFTFFKNDNETYEVTYALTEFEYELDDADRNMFYSNYADSVEYEETQNDESEIIITFSNNSSEYITIAPAVVWYKDGEVIGITQESPFDIGAGEEGGRAFEYPFYNDEIIIPDGYEIVIGPATTN